jgi:sorbitol/mannitol transport system substrate-binding protein
VANGYNELLALFSEGHCGVWLDATIAASFVTDPAVSTVADKVGFAQAPVALTPKGANWLWAWALAVPAGTQKAAAARRFVLWATSRDYIAGVARSRGWAAVPTGTRQSTYAEPAFRQVARFAVHEKAAIDSANPYDATLPRSPYVGVQWAAIPEFQRIGQAVGQQIGAVLAGRTSLEQALKASQALAEREMRSAGHTRPP